jgi:hypothetical protein
MPFSWLRVPGNTSPKVLACMGDDRTKERFAACVKEVVAGAGGKADHIWFEQNGIYAHVHVFWETVDQRTAIIFDLHAEQAVDLSTPTELDRLAQERGTG